MEGARLIVDRGFLGLVDDFDDLIRVFRISLFRVPVFDDINRQRIIDLRSNRNLLETAWLLKFLAVLLRTDAQKLTQDHPARESAQPMVIEVSMEEERGDVQSKQLPEE